MRDENLKADANNFTIVRLILASLVIYTHSYWLVTGVSNKDDLSDFLGAGVSAFAVDGFFFLSGFLVYPSLLRLQSAGRFLLARAARLWPGLAVSLLVMVAGGATVTTASGLAYLQGDTARFILNNVTFLQGFFTLTGVNCGADPCVINGSLWTLPWEARCYLVLAFLGLVGLARPGLMKWIVLPATLAGAVLWDIPAVPRLTESLLGSGAVYYLTTADRLWPLFALGAAAYLFRERLPLSWLILAVLFLLMLGANALGVGLHFRALFVGYLVLCMGLLTARKGAISGGWHDYSYGMYIYAFPVMMAVHAVLPTPSHWVLGAATFAATLPFAMLSWHFVEKPVLDAVKRRRARRAAVSAQPA
ncbi:MAG TPA: acyltransferase [Phenylobacterium sp.]|nr:acyltransferase [Phenylobacterium sp.]